MNGTARCTHGRNRVFRSRDAAVLLVVLVSAGIATVVLVTILKLMVGQQRILRTELRQAQAAWLVESGLERAAARLADQPGYQGETWAVPPAELGGGHSARVSISVETTAGRPARRMVRVVADYPDQFPHRVRRSKQAVLELNQGDTQP